MRNDTDHRPWEPGNSSARVLLECPAGSSPSIIARVVERHGFEVRTCEGPGDRGGCDLIDHGTCTLVSGADVVVNMLAERDPDGSEVLTAVLNERRPPATVVELTPQKRDRTPRRDDETNDAGAVTVISTPVTSAALIDGIHTAIELRDRPTPWWGEGVS